MARKADSKGEGPLTADGEQSQETPKARTRKTAKPRTVLSEVYQIAATRIGSGERATDVARDLGVDEGRLSHLKWGTDKLARQYQSLMKQALDQAIALAGTTALRRLLTILDKDTVADRDAAAAAREVENMRRNQNALQTDLAKLDIERNRLDIQRSQADALNRAADGGVGGLVILPGKVDPAPPGG